MFSSPAALFGSLQFGAIGLGAFMCGKRMVLYKPMVIGFVLMTYPYFLGGVDASVRIVVADCAGCEQPPFA